LPSFLLADRSFAVAAAEQLVATYMKQPENWQQQLPLTMDLSTAYRWLRRLSNQANTSLPDIRKALLKLKTDDQLTQPFQTKVAPVTSNHDLLKRFFTFAQQLLEAVLYLAKPKPVADTNVFTFLNYFLATHTGKALLQG
jgi:hypothetical protein